VIRDSGPKLAVSSRQLAATANCPLQTANSSSLIPHPSVQVLEDANDLLHAAGGARDLRGVVRLLLLHHPHEIDDAVLGDHLHVQRVEFLAVEEARLDLGGDDGIAAADGVRAHSGDGHLVVHAAHVLDGPRDALRLGPGRGIGHLPGQQDHAVVTRHVDVHAVLEALADAADGL
jgi:hypothetical protein